MSQDHNHLNHATWECKYHVVFTPKYRKKALFGQIRRHLGTVFRELAQRQECKIEEGPRPRGMRRRSALTSKIRRSRTSSWIGCN
jgi:hypothetical protein